jgi:tetratricopeptide (TPR) repeat protein
MMAQAFLTQGRVDDARIYYQKAIAIDPYDGLSQRGLGDLLLHLDRPTEAAPHLEIAVDQRPDDADAHYALATALSRSGDLERALHHYEEVARLAPGRAGVKANVERLRALLHPS